MSRKETTVRSVGRTSDGLSRSSFHPECSTVSPESQGPDAAHRPSFRDGMIWVAGRHLASVRGGVLYRSFDGTRELLFGGLYFRLDVIRVAQEAGATKIHATDRTSGVSYQVDLGTFLKCGRPYRHLKFGEQIGLALSAWEKVPEPGSVRQLSFFGGGA